MAESSVSTEDNSSLPKLVYSEDVKSQDCPYDVMIDPAGIPFLLSTAGVKLEDIPHVSVAVQRKPDKDLKDFFGDVLGTYDRKTKTAIIFTDPFWNLQQGVTRRSLEKHQEITSSGSGQDNPENEFPDLVSGKRLSWFIRSAPPERSRKTIQRLVGLKINRIMNRKLAHEASHAADDSNKELGFIKQFRPKDYFKRGILSNAISASLSQGSVLLLDSFGALPNDTTRFALGVSLGMGGSFVATGWTILTYVREGALKNKTEIKAYKFGREQEGRHKIITISPKQAPLDQKDTLSSITNQATGISG